MKIPKNSIKKGKAITFKIKGTVKGNGTYKVKINKVT